MGAVRRSILVFIAGVLGVLGALGWMTVHALRLERSELEARRDAKYQESVRLALWRMDAAVTPIIAREAARPHFHYQSFYVPDRAYQQLTNRAEEGDVPVPSPLLRESDYAVRLHYQKDAAGNVTSPQVPEGSLKELAKGAFTTSYRQATTEDAFTRLTAMFADTKKAAGYKIAGAGGFFDDAKLKLEHQWAGQAPHVANAEQSESLQSLEATNDYTKRENLVRSQNAPQQRAQRGNISELEGAPKEKPSGEARKDASAPGRGDAPASPETDKGVGADPATSAAESAARPEDAVDRNRPLVSEDEGVVTGPFEPRWIVRDGVEPELIFEREVRLGAESIRQGFWIDWPALRSELLSSVAEMFPQAKLSPLPGGVESASPSVLGRTLAAIPAELVTPVPPPAEIPLLTPVRTTLGLTWALALAAVVVIALVLRASMELAERRGQFVSAVTHELRTPLTTFVMYSQMLADGLVRDEESQRSYIGTLKSESQRLARIVESVLDFARLSKRKRPATVRARLTAEQIVNNLVPVLRARCEQGGMELVVERESLLDFPVTTDPPTLERIIYNLVDNACKYAAASDDKRIHLVAHVERRDLVLAVKDHGPGIDLKERAQVFRAFTRGRKQHDGNIPGLGLGLALAQGLARELGGDLRLASEGPGAEFHVRLPRD
ncbi:Autoinducer 2 sensor kinase/phosphatase LuxQ [Phycisphaerales bacterium]|nr:Autoinducer 2 sensor kinase/phosphatase LuxQ [Phycisphaerales bacterium]